MPVQKFRSLDEAQRALWGNPCDGHYLRRLAWLFRLADRLAPRHYPRGVHRYRSMAEANEAREAWEGRLPPERSTRPWPEGQDGEA